MVNRLVPFVGDDDASRVVPQAGWHLSVSKSRGDTLIGFRYKGRAIAARPLP